MLPLCLGWPLRATFWHVKARRALEGVVTLDVFAPQWQCKKENTCS
jgi:hypothetical protein